jgi:regulator of sigma D
MDEGNLPTLDLTAELQSLSGMDFENIVELGVQIRRTSISSSKAWDEQIYHRVKDYLSTRNPRQQLDDLKSILNQIREALERNFSLQDILLEIGDKRLDADYHAYPFPPKSYK